MTSDTTRTPTTVVLIPAMANASASPADVAPVPNGTTTRAGTGSKPASI